MSKIDKDALVAEIGRLRNMIERSKFRSEDDKFESYTKDGYGLALDDVLSFINSLPDNPVSDDLDEAAEAYEEENRSDYGYRLEIQSAFIAGADWQSERMAKSMPLPEDTVLFQKGVAEGRRLEREDMTWQDCKRIVEIADALTEYAEAGIIEPFLASEEAYYTEVLRKFKEK